MTAATPSMAELDAARRMSHGELLRRLARTHPDRVAFTYEGANLTFAELDRGANRLARALASRGVGRGDRVALLLGNHLEHVETLFAVMRLGAIAVPVNIRLVPSEVRFLLEDSGATVVVVDQALAAVVAEARTGTSVAACLVVGDGPATVDLAADDYHEAAAAEPDDPLVIDVDDHEPALIVYTSGTTGRPKGAVLSHFNLLMNSINAVFEQRLFGDDEVWYGNLPMFHIGGLNGILLYFLVGGRSVIVPLGGFDPARAADDLESNAVTGCCFVGTGWQQLCQLPDLTSRRFRLRRIVWGTSGAIIPTLEAMARSFPDVPIYNFFGQTEMSSVTCVLPGEDFVAKMGSVGKPIINVEARLVDDHMRDVAPGEVGEIVYRGPTVMQGYWHLPDATEEVFAGGWFHSGDLCRQDDDGYIWVVDRKKDMIISGGENIYSAEVEAALLSHPGVAEVAVIGVADARWGETPWAVVVPTDPSAPPTEAELIGHCRQRLASYKKPGAVRFVDALPRNATGKVVKPELRRQFGPSELSEAGR